MRPHEIKEIWLNSLCNPKQKPGTDISFSINVQELFEKLKLQTAQRSRFLPPSQATADRTALDAIDSTFDLYTITEDELNLFSSFLAEASDKLAEVLLPYSPDSNMPVKTEGNSIVFAAAQPLKVIPENYLVAIKNNINNAAFYYCFAEWCRTSQSDEYQLWLAKFEKELEKLKGNLTKRKLPVVTPLRSLG